MSIRVAIDIGGTFTDFVSLNEKTSEIIDEKAHTTPENFAEGVINALKKSGVDLKDVAYFVHGTTVVINAVTERKGAKTALVTTNGFRDVLEIGRANRPDMYNYFYKKPQPYVPRYLRFEVDERVNYQGEVLRAVREEEIIRIAQQLKAENVSAVAVCLLHSYTNPEHEKFVGSVLRREIPGVEVTLSSDLVKVWREYERTSTTVLNAYVQPAARKYLDTLQNEMEKMGLAIEPHAMQSNGGTATFARAKEIPISLIESGPVGGVIGANELGKIIGEDNIITFDIGGTTAKTSLISRGDVKVTTDYRLERTPLFAGYPVKSPVVDIIEIGNGGGSIAWIDDVGVLKVGPQSAGANPGPACYGLGGMEPTLTDATLITGRIDPDNFLGGEFKVSLELAKKAIQPIADHFGISVEEVALGVVKTATNNMLNVLKLISVRRGYDPREFSMVAMGGNGAVLSPFLGAELKIAKVIVPKLPSTFSAWGMLMTDLRQDFIQTQIMPVVGADFSKINSIYGEMEKEALDIFERQNIDSKDLVFVRTADLRYVGQEHTVKTPVRNGEITVEDLKYTRESFDQAHRQQYTFSMEYAPAEFVNFNLTVFGTVTKPQIKKIPPAGVLDNAIKGERPINFEEHGWLNCKVYDRTLLGPGHKIEGPAAVEEPKSVTILCPGQVLQVDEYGNLIIQTGVQIDG
ncbi:hydantoinase/oxoprolinase family protein [Desulfosporosinus metallidurans]|uniref:N-methylhydantoinase A n=1 Tax=Desulfosporosinus metallidurans TaxID=1888891 RepID=A0A1Q8QP79_9FIRM|nr:hydantoinase/oxoprolinase family protein [Desulfosporosinus metallidurans]OLN29151.1 N-methylhydantoinase A [Desulfosporosinus metallidurans]